MGPGPARAHGPGPGPRPWAGPGPGPGRARPRLRRGSKFPDSSTIGENCSQENQLFFDTYPLK